MTLRRALAWTLALAVMTVAWSPAAGAHDPDCEAEPAAVLDVDSSEVDVYAPPENGCKGAMAHDDRLDCTATEDVGGPASHGHVADGSGCWTGFVVKDDGAA